MKSSLYQKLINSMIQWFTKEPPPKEIPPCDFDRLKYEIRPGDVLLIEGQSRISEIIRRFTQSPWTHAALYVGRLHDIEDHDLRKIVVHHMKKKENVRLVIEGMLDQGTVVTPLNNYRHNHIRICRPIGISPTDAEHVIAFTIKSLGQSYNIRQLFDLARFLLPWSILPRRWGSSLFHTSSGEPESGVCSSLIAEAFLKAKFPILPFLKPDEKAGIELVQRNPHLYTPKDFDYSPYFEIIKYPLLSAEEVIPYYHRLPWAAEGSLYQGHGVVTKPHSPKKKKHFLSGLLSRRKDDENNSDHFPPETD